MKTVANKTQKPLKVRLPRGYLDARDDDSPPPPVEDLAGWNAALSGG